jgi:hypothetical protein
MKKYEDNRTTRRFQDHWLKGREWLKHDERGMTCIICSEHYGDVSVRGADANNSKKHLFITGSKNYKFSTISDHEKSTTHTEVVRILESRKKETETEQSTAQKTVISMREHLRKQIELKFRNVHALIKKNRPLSDYIWLNELDRAKGLDLSQTYDNLTAGTLFMEYISVAEKEKLSVIMDEVKFFSMTMDGSTDDGSCEQETIFVRSSVRGKLVSRFLCIGEPDSTGSSDLFSFVRQKVEENGLADHMTKLVGFGCDGASNMMGCKSGLITRLKDIYPEIVGIHCLAHRLELSFRDAFKSNTLYEKLSTLLLSLFYFYKRSPKMRKSLKETIKVKSHVHF